MISLRFSFSVFTAVVALSVSEAEYFSCGDSFCNGEVYNENCCCVIDEEMFCCPSHFLQCRTTSLVTFPPPTSDDDYNYRYWDATTTTPQRVETEDPKWWNPLETESPNDDYWDATTRPTPSTTEWPHDDWWDFTPGPFETEGPDWWKPETPHNDWDTESPDWWKPENPFPDYYDSTSSIIADYFDWSTSSSILVRDHDNTAGIPGWGWFLISLGIVGTLVVLTGYYGCYRRWRGVRVQSPMYISTPILQPLNESQDIENQVNVSLLGPPPSYFDWKTPAPTNV